MHINGYIEMFPTVSQGGIGERPVRNVSRRLIPFLCVHYTAAFLGRVNFGYAALDMNNVLGISQELFGFLSGIFFTWYLLFEVPANMILPRIGSRACPAAS